jgi:hypothetical protein
VAADVVNLRQARKAKARVIKDAQAAENRVKFGRTRAEKQRTAAEEQRASRRLDQLKRQNDDQSGS